MPYAIRSVFAVRSYEIDSYGHLNNGVFVSWFEQGRLDHLEGLGFSYDGFARREQWLVVARTEIDFRRPLTLGESVQLHSWIEGLGRSSVRYRQVMRLTAAGELEAAAPLVTTDAACDEALTVMVFSGDGGGSIAIPRDFRQALTDADAGPAEA